MPTPDKPKRKKPRVTTSLTWIERAESLAPWMTQYCLWLAQHPEAVLSKPMPEKDENGRRGWARPRPYTSERTARASRFACRKISARLIQALERRKDFIALFEKCRADAQFMARQLGQQQIIQNFEAREIGLQAALGEKDEKGKYKSVDHKSIEHYTRPFVELAFPKKVEGQEQAPRIVINISGGGSLAPLLGAGDDEIPDVDYEIIPPKQLTDGEDDEDHFIR